MSTPDWIFNIIGGIIIAIPFVKCFNLRSDLNSIEKKLDSNNLHNSRDISDLRIKNMDFCETEYVRTMILQERNAVNERLIKLEMKVIELEKRLEDKKT